MSRRPGEHVYTVAAQTDAAGLLYLTVSVVRTAGGSLALAGYPAFVGAPGDRPGASAGAPARSQRTGARDGRGTRAAQLPGRLGLELAADLASGARVSLPAAALSLESVQRLDWAPGAGAVLAVVQAEDARGARYTLAYELDVARGRAAGRSPRSRWTPTPDAIEQAAPEALQ